MKINKFFHHWSLTAATALQIAWMTEARQSIAVPSFINYQGALLDSTGNKLPDGNTNVVFRVYDAVFQGNLVWGPRTNSVALVGSVFSTVLGGMDNQSRDFATALIGQATTPGASAFLELTVGGATIQPRQQILSTPFAFVANAARTAQNADHAIQSDEAAHALSADNSTKAQNAIHADSAATADQANNANLLLGHDWSALLSSSDPTTGTLDGSRITAGTIGLDRLNQQALALEPGASKLRVVRGVINSDGTIRSGEGFTAAASGLLASVTFNHPFSDTPAVTVSYEPTDANNYFCKVLSPFRFFGPNPPPGTGFFVAFYNSNGSQVSTPPPFRFIAIGKD